MLLVEDELMVQGFLQQRLALEPDMRVVATVASVWDAQEVLARQEVDVVLLDHYLEDADGMHLLRSMRGAPTAAARAARVLFCTGYTSALFADEAKANGARGVVDKHRLGEELVPALRAVYAGQEWFPGEWSLQTSARPERLRILVVEDGAPMRQLLAEVLTEAGLLPRLVWSAEEALELLEREPYDLLLLDPQLGGHLATGEILEEIQEVAPELPVLLLAQSADEVDRLRDHPGVRSVLAPPFGAASIQEAAREALVTPDGEDTP